MLVIYEAKSPAERSDDWITGVQLIVNGIRYRITETQFEGEVRLETDQRIGIMPESDTSFTICPNIKTEG